MRKTKLNDKQNKIVHDASMAMLHAMVDKLQEKNEGENTDIFVFILQELTITMLDLMIEVIGIDQEKLYTEYTRGLEQFLKMRLNEN